MNEMLVYYIHLRNDKNKTKKAKEDLFSKVNKGQIRIVIGSTQKLGTGVNAQKKIVALIESEFQREAIVVPGVVKQVHS